MSQAHTTLCNVRDELRTCLLERDSTIDCAMLALLTGQHLLLLGPPGTGKSLLVRSVQQRLVDTTYFEKLLTQFTVPDEIFGPVDLVRYADHGEYRRMSAGALSEAHVAFLDEIFKSNSAILNSLLTITNERLIHEVGMPPQRVPLMSLFGASNEVPADATLHALDDRFTLRDVVDYVHDDAAFVALITEHFTTEVTATMTLADLRMAQEEVPRVKGHTDVLQALLTLRTRLSDEGVLVSDRRWAAVPKILKAQAWLDGRSELDVETLTCLQHVLWTNPKERSTVERCVYAVASPLHLRAMELEDQAAEVFATLPPDTSSDFTNQAENILQQLVDQHTLLKTTIATSHARNMERAEQSLARIARMYRHITEKLTARLGKLEL